MFHDGDLQSGISRAITEQKLVACFIRADDNEESQKWEQKWLGSAKRPSMLDIFSTKAVFLKIEYDSQEMSFLGAFCPITAVPTLVIIDRGQVLEKVESGVSHEEFSTRIGKALDMDVFVASKDDIDAARARGASSSSSSQQPSTSAAQNLGDEMRARLEKEAAEIGMSQEELQMIAQHLSPTWFEQLQQLPPDRMRAMLERSKRQLRELREEYAGGGATQNAVPSDTPSESGVATPSSQDAAAPAPSNSSIQPGSSANMTSLFPDRAQRHEEEKAKKDAAEKAERAARAKARRLEAEKAEKGKGKATDASEQEKARRDWLVKQNERKNEAKKERERILAQIEADKQERKARSQRAQGEAPLEPLLSPSVDAASRRIMGAGGMCNLSIRLFDGTSIKGRFEPSATLAKTVRDWIRTTTTEQGNANAADIPFTFKQIMAPLPSRSIEVSEEHQTLADLSLTPNATLVLIPVEGFTEAYSSAGRGYMSSALHYTYALANGASSILGSALSYVVPGTGSRAEAPPADAPASSSPTPLDGSSDTTKIKVKTLADQRAEATKKDQSAEFYNGNSSAFEGRKDDDDKK